MKTILKLDYVLGIFWYAIWIKVSLRIISYVFGEKVHVLTEAITKRFRAMAIEVVLFVFGIMESLIGNLSGHCPVRLLTLQFVLCGSCMHPWYSRMWMWLISLCYLGVIWVPGTPTCERESTVYNLRVSTYLKVLGIWLVPYEWVAAGPPSIGITWMSCR